MPSGACGSNLDWYTVLMPSRCASSGERRTRIHGTPTRDETRRFTVLVRDGSGYSATRRFTIEIKED